ncbi:MAG: hypothetical protein WCF16_05480, partial [Alphaproteobacteria bacterium]
MRETSAKFELLIDALPGEVRAALLKNGRLSEFAVERRNRSSRMGEIFLGRVARVEKGLGAFVDIGLRAHGFLSGHPKGGGPSEGERVLV